MRDDLLIVGIVAIVAVVGLLLYSNSVYNGVGYYRALSGHAFITGGGVGRSSCVIDAGMVGDVDNNSIVDDDDTTELVNYLYLSQPLDDNALTRADVNGDGAATMQDLLLIANFVYGYLGEFPVCENASGGPLGPQGSNPECGDTITEDTMLTQDLTDCPGTGLVIGADNVVLDCAGHRIRGDGSGDDNYGVYVNNRHNVVVRDCNIEGFEDGVRITHSSFVSVIGGEIRNNNEHGVLIRQDSNNITLQGLNVHDVSTGVGVYDNSYNVVIRDSSFSDNSDHGIVLSTGTHNNTVVNNTANNNHDGIRLHWSSNNFLVNNTANNNYEGMHLFSFDNNFLANNTVSNNSHYGIYGYYHSNSNVFKNNLVFNNGKGVGIDYTHDNLFFNNVFNNSLNWELGSHVGFNSWNNSFTGNLWLKPDGGGYSQTCGDNDNNGFCDDAYVLADNNVDYKPIVASAGGVDVNPPEIVITSPANNSVVSSPFSLKFSITDDSGVNVNSLAYKLDDNTWISVNPDNCAYIPEGRFCTVSGLSLNSGFHTISVKGSDLAGHEVIVSNGFSVDVESPSVVIISPANNSVVYSPFSLKFSITDDSGVDVNSLAYRLDDNSWVSVDPNNCAYIPEGRFCTVSGLSLNSGFHTVSVKGYDLAGNSAYTTTSFEIANSGQISCGDTITEDTTLTADLTDCQGHGLVIGADNIVLDCDGHWISGDGLGTDYGILVNNQDYIDIQNCRLRNFSIGIYLDHSNHNTVFNSIIRDNGMGIKSYGSSNNLIHYNEIINNQKQGIRLLYSHNNDLINNSILRNYQAVSINKSNFNQIINNSFTTYYNIWLHNYIVFDGSDSNIFKLNYVSSNANGQIKFVGSLSVGNIIRANVFRGDENAALELSAGKDNTIYENTFNNTLISLGLYHNYWNTGVGNLWLKDDGTGFSQTCNDGDGDGICDEEYMLNNQNIDYKPKKA